MRAYSYLNSAEAIIRKYDGKMPLAAWLKAWFREEKKFGSRDRKEIAHACYGYYRANRLFNREEPLRDVLLKCLFLSPGPSHYIIESLRPGWMDQLERSLEERLRLLGITDVQALFPLHEAISDAIDKHDFLIAHLVQPNLHLRLRPGRESVAMAKIRGPGLSYAACGTHCVALPNGSRIEEVIALNRDAVVQDRCSQEVLHMLDGYLEKEKTFSAWDCCAASGGKSIQLYDLYPKVKLTVSDIRESILVNLRKRFAEAGIRSYKSFVADAGRGPGAVPGSFDLVVCDAPCSGSGTWSRTPEQLEFFKEEGMAHYAGLQEKISQNAWQQVKEGGLFLYITCSVFKAENEAQVEKLSRNMELVKAGYCRGYNSKGDTLYAALFRRL